MTARVVGTLKRWKHALTYPKATATARRLARRGVKFDTVPLLGEGVVIEAGVHLVGPVFANHGVFIERGAVIGPSVSLGPGTKVLTTTHEFGTSSCRAGDVLVRPTTIREGVWSGASVTILPGVRVARGCVLGAGAVVTRDTEPDGLYLGNPARRVKDLST